MMDIIDRLEIAAPVEAVWAHTVNVASWPQLTPTITSVELLDDGPLVVGSRARIVQPHQRPRIWTVTTLDAPTRFEWKTRVGPVEMVGGHRIEATPTGCVNSLSVELSGPGSALLRAVLGRALQRTIATENQGFRRAAETTVDASGGGRAP